MKLTSKLLFLAALSAAAINGPAAAAQAVSAAPVKAVAGKMLFDVAGKRVGPVYSVDKDGSAQIIVDDHMVTVPVTTLSNANGKLSTSMTVAQVNTAH